MADNLRTLMKLLKNYLLEGRDPPPSYLERLISFRKSLRDKVNEDDELMAKIGREALNLLDQIIAEIKSYYDYKEALRKYDLGIRELEAVEASEVEEKTTQVRKYSPIGYQSKLVLVTFLTDVPKFVGEDLKTYGPFTTGDLAWIPKGNVKILEEKGVIKVIT